jgi:hypothetical protein
MTQNKFENNQVINLKSKNLVNRMYENNSLVQKQRINSYNQLIRYYNVKLPIPVSIQKIMLLIELQLNAALTRAKLVPYIFMVADLCRLGVINVDSKPVTNQFQIMRV